MIAPVSDTVARGAPAQIDTSVAHEASHPTTARSSAVVRQTNIRICACRV